MNKPRMYVAREDEVRGGASASTMAHEAETSAFENDDPFHDPTVGWVMLMLFLAFLAFSGWLFAIYLGVEYGTPPWSANSYPPPLVK